MKRYKCVKCRSYFDWVLPMSCLIWLHCSKCKRDIRGERIMCKFCDMGRMKRDQLYILGELLSVKDLAYLLRKVKKEGFVRDD
jgi:hypothetical protein